MEHNHANLDNLMEPPTSKSANLENVMKPPICLLYQVIAMHPSRQIEWFHQQQRVHQPRSSKTAMDPNHIDPILPPATKPFDDVAVETPKKDMCNCMKMHRNGVIGSSNLIMLDSYQDSLNVNSNLIMTGTIVGIPGKYSCFWTISWVNYFAKQLS